MGKPAVWSAVAAGCRAAQLVGLNRRRWTARRGYALRRAGYVAEAAAAYSRAVSGTGDVRSSELVDRLEGGEYGEVPASWMFNLALCRRRLGDPDTAARLLSRACQVSPGHARWYAVLSLVEEERGNVANAIDAQRRAVELSDDPKSLHRLAFVHAQGGEWGKSRELLTANIAKAPSFAESRNLLADVDLAQARWGGCFTGEYRDGIPVFSYLPGVVEGADPLAVEAVAAQEQAVELAPSKLTWQADLADAHSAAGDHRAATQVLENALRAVETVDARWVLGAKQRWQFRLEHAYHLLGEPRVNDPLFSCGIRPVEDRPTGEHPVVGLFHARLSHTGIVVNGFVAPDHGGHIEILLDGVLLRAVNLSQEGYFRRFSFAIKRRTLALFPHTATLEVRSADHHYLSGPGGSTRVELTVPHGSQRLLDVLADGGKVDKKGVISPSPEETRQRQERYLEIYSRVREFFEDKLGRSVFLMYGTLLGFHRDGDFIPGDDDFDAGYVSDRTDPLSVKEETKDIIVELVRAGFTVSFNRRGRLFRVQLERGATDGYHVDLRPLWFQGGKLWVHNHVCLPLTREDFLPVVEGTLRDVPVSAPRNTEAFLRGHYGPGWKVPDPGFTYYASEVDPAVRQNLSKALITVAEYRDLAARVEAAVRGTQGAGRFVSIGSQDLYPLEDFIS